MFATLTGACTEPRIIFPTDGGADGSPSSSCEGDDDCTDDDEPAIMVDADVPVVTTPQTGWAQPFRNSYAMRVRRFGTFGTSPQATRVAIESIVKAKIDTDTAKGVVLLRVEELCSEQTILTPSGSGRPITTAVTFPFNYPETEYTLTAPASDWGGSRTKPALIGYVDNVAGCTPGQEVDSFQPVHSWLQGKKCQCVLDEAADAPPTVQNDCRLTDPDEDSGPGISSHVTAGGAGTDFVVIRDQSKIVHGRFNSTLKHTALLDFRADYHQLRCAGRNCETAPLRPCSLSHNPVDLALISDGVSRPAEGCAEILKRTDLFPNVPFRFPEVEDCH